MQCGDLDEFQLLVRCTAHLNLHLEFTSVNDISVEIRM